MVLLAQRLGALIIEPEHRGYGVSQPTPPFDTRRLALITPQQALADAVALIGATQAARNCTGRAGQVRCPVVTVGGSYPGWLSAMMRLRYPAVVDAAYAASAPLGWYSQDVDQYAYYNVITESARRASPGCPDAVRRMFAGSIAGASKADIVAGLGLCAPLPPYLDAGDASLLADEVAMVVAYSFANLNMANYPPPNTALRAACLAIEAAPTPWAAMAGFLATYSAEGAATPGACYNLSSQLPSGANATISSGDWSGVGTGNDGSAWDWETCTFLVESIGFNNVTDMFPPRAWSMAWLNQHCGVRFGVQPQPRALADAWGFDAATLPRVASRIVFTNGLNDGWSAGGIVTNLSSTLLAFNAPNGAHHSDLSHSWPSDADTPDVVAVRAAAADVIAGWLADLPGPAAESAAV